MGPCGEELLSTAWSVAVSQFEVLAQAPVPGIEPSRGARSLRVSHTRHRPSTLAAGIRNYRLPVQGVEPRPPPLPESEWRSPAKETAALRAPSAFWFPFSVGESQSMGNGNQVTENDSAHPSTSAIGSRRARKRVRFAANCEKVVHISRDPIDASLSVVTQAEFVKQSRLALYLRLKSTQSGKHLSGASGDAADGKLPESVAGLLTARAIELARAIQYTRRRLPNRQHLERLWRLCRDEEEESVGIVSAFIDYGEVGTVADVLVDPYF